MKHISYRLLFVLFLNCIPLILFSPKHGLKFTSQYVFDDIAAITQTDRNNYVKRIVTTMVTIVSKLK